MLFVTYILTTALNIFPYKKNCLGKKKSSYFSVSFFYRWFCIQKWTERYDVMNLNMNRIFFFIFASVNLNVTAINANDFSLSYSFYNCDNILFFHWIVSIEIRFSFCNQWFEKNANFHRIRIFMCAFKLQCDLRILLEFPTTCQIGRERETLYI